MMSFNPAERREAGTFNPDMKPGMSYKKGSTQGKIGSLEARNYANTVNAGGKSKSKGADHAANFTTDADMGLIKSAGKSGKY